jgi:hypothetical protein
VVEEGCRGGMLLFGEWFKVRGKNEWGRKRVGGCFKWLVGDVEMAVYSVTGRLLQKPGIFAGALSFIQSALTIFQRDNPAWRIYGDVAQPPGRSGVWRCVNRCAYGHSAL